MRFVEGSKSGKLAATSVLTNKSLFIHLCLSFIGKARQNSKER